ncbi:MAG: anthranilate synthase component I [Caldilineaceae bacterium]|nr:anthranilate synthase component I [Caldilineaceae bacterium]
MSTQYHPTLDEVRKLADLGNLIAVHRELPADLETPVSVYLKLRGQGEDRGGLSFLLESVEKGEQLGRFSFIGVHPPMTVVARGDEVIIGGAGGTVLESRRGDPLAIVSEMMAGRTPVQPAESLPRFTGGAVGYFGYDLVRFIERLPETAAHDLDVPDMMLLFCDNLVVFDHVRHRLSVIANMRAAGDEGELRAAYADAVARIDNIVRQLQQPLVPPATPAVESTAEWTSNFTQAEHEANVRAAKERIAAGDIFQVVLSQRLSRKTQADPFTIYRALRMLNPSPYMYFLDFEGIAGVEGEPVRIIGSSPELHVRLEDEFAYLHPIAGTRWRGATPDEDAALAKELLDDPKERAEHVMLVDLGRNDLGRVCEYGSVTVPTMMAVEKYSHVMHIVSDVRGRIQPQHDAFSLLRATFPAGTVSGAPKVRAMEIIEELEGTRRGPYAGAVGYIGYDGAMDTCITIRTITMQGDTCYLQAGGGIVADSDPTAEHQESLNKAKALAVAVEEAERGL